MIFQKKNYHLPRQILFFMMIGVLICASSGLYAFQQISSRLDASASSDSQEQVKEGLKFLQSQVRLFSKDYNNWTDVYNAALRGDINFIANNYGITANQGEIFEFALLAGGPLKNPVSWVKNGKRDAGGLIFSPETLASAEVALEIQEQIRPSIDFFSVENEKIYIVTAAYLLPDPEQAISPSAVRASAVALIGRHLSSRDLAVIEHDAGINDLHITTRPGIGYLSTSLPDVKGNTIFYLAWKAAKPGSALVGQLAPVIAIITTAFVALAALATWLVHRNAMQLVLREVEARELARTDPLTGLPNRLSFNEAFQNEPTDIIGELAIVMIDLDRLKQTNDLFGHAAGDYILQSFSDALTSCADPSTFIARLGGDEFCAIVRGSGAAERAKALLAVLEIRCSKPIKVHSESVHLSFSAGIAINILGEHFEETLRKADLALCQGKSAIGERIAIYDTDMDLADKSTLLIEQALRGAIRSPEEFCIVYQPIVSAVEEDIVRVEALARWDNPILGPVSPNQFITVAEKSGLITELGWIIVDKILEDIKNRHIFASINISPLQLMKPDFLSELLFRIDRAGVPTSRIQIELTENVLVRNQKYIVERIREVRSAGIKVALDDFGTGFSAISYITATEFDSIKIDKSLIRDSAGDSSCRDFFNSIVSLSLAVSKNVVVEGVETQEQLKTAKSSGAHAFQGYLHGMPVNIDKLCTVLQKLSPSNETFQSATDESFIHLLHKRPAACSAAVPSSAIR